MIIIQCSYTSASLRLTKRWSKDPLLRLGPLVTLLCFLLGFKFRFLLFTLLGSSDSGYDIFEWVLDDPDRLDLGWAGISTLALTFTFTLGIGRLT